MAMAAPASWCLVGARPKDQVSAVSLSLYEDYVDVHGMVRHDDMRVAEVLSVVAGRLALGAAITALVAVDTSGALALRT